jgi:hypothetical protein
MWCIIGQALQNERQNGAEERQRSAVNTAFNAMHGVAPTIGQKLNVAIAKQSEKTLDETCHIL